MQFAKIIIVFLSLVLLFIGSVGIWSAMQLPEDNKGLKQVELYSSISVLVLGFLVGMITIIFMRTGHPTIELQK